jgi:hypothetical protein
MFWGAGGELGQALPLLPFLDGLRVREPSANPRRDTITRLLRGELTAERGADVLAVLAEQLMALVGDGWRVRRAPADADDRHDAPGAPRDDLLALRRVVPDHARLHFAGLRKSHP